MGASKHGVDSTPIVLKNTFHTLSLTFLTLLVPLSFLLLCRLTTSSHLLTSNASNTTALSSTLISIFITINPILLNTLVSFICLASLLHALTGYFPKLHRCFAWAFLCIFEACVGLGIEATIAAGFKTEITTSIGHVMRIQDMIFFIGLYEIMQLWSRMFVRPVVDDTIFGVAVEERCMNKMTIGVAFSVLWLWMFHDEVEPLVLAAGKKGLLVQMGWEGFVPWLVSYVAFTTGVVRIVEGFVCMGELLLLYCREADEDLVCCAPEDNV